MLHHHDLNNTSNILTRVWFRGRNSTTNVSQASLDTCRGVDAVPQPSFFTWLLAGRRCCWARAIRRPPTCGRWPAWCSSLSLATCSLTRAPARITSGAGCVRSMPMSVQSRTDQSQDLSSKLDSSHRVVRQPLEVIVLSALPQSTVQLNVSNSCSTTSVHAAGPHALSVCLLDGYWRHVG